jgi:hypothetical protein
LLFGSVFGNAGAIAARAVVGNVISQGVGIITGQQSGFSWASLAVSAVSAPISNSINEKIFGKTIDQFGNRGGGLFDSPGSKIFAQVGSGLIDSGVRELTRVAIQGGRVNWSSVALGGVQGYANTIAETVARQREAAGNTTTLNGNSNSSNQAGGSVEGRDRYLDMSTADSSGKILPRGLLSQKRSTLTQEQSDGIDDAITVMSTEAAYDFLDRRDAEITNKLANAIASRDASDSYTVDADAQLFKRVKQVVDGESANQMANELAKGNKSSAYAIAAKQVVYDFLAPESYLGAGLLIFGGPLLRGVGKGFSAAFPATSSAAINLANKNVSVLFGNAATKVESLFGGKVIDAVGRQSYQTLDDVTKAINRNADIATELARRALERGKIGDSPSAFGTYAHEMFDKLNKRLDRNLLSEGSSYRVSAEEFRDLTGGPAFRNAKGSIGPDVRIYDSATGSSLKVLDLKTYGNVQLPINNARQQLFIKRFGLPAEEIYKQR